METETDESLFLDGRDTAMTQLVGRYERPLFRFLLHLVGDPHLAEDLFQETFLRLHRARGGYREGSALKPYLYRIALNVAHDVHAKWAGRPKNISLDAPSPNTGGGEEERAEPGRQVEGRVPAPAMQAESNELHAEIRTALGALPEPERVVVILRMFEELSFAQIAEATGVPIPTAKSRMLYALRRMRPLLERYLAGNKGGAGNP